MHDITTTCDSSLVIGYEMSSANAVTKMSSDADADVEIDLGGKNRKTELYNKRRSNWCEIYNRNNNSRRKYIGFNSGV